MNGYLLGIIGTVLLSSLLTALLPEGKTAGVIKGVTRLACLVAILAPIPNFLQSVGENDENSLENSSQSVISTDESFIEYFREMRITLQQDALENEILDRFCIETQAVFVWEVEEEDMSLSEIKITRIIIQPQTQITAENRAQIAEYLTKNYCSEVLIE